MAERVSVAPSLGTAPRISPLAGLSTLMVALLGEETQVPLM
jgi:hypothetical protein